jgi:hypothetical protein
VVDVAGEIDPDTGLLAYSEVVLIAMRQQGKSEILLPVMTQRCTGFEHAGPQTVLYTAQTGDDARHKWRDVHLPRLQKAPMIRKLVTPRLTYSSEAFLWRNGSMWMPGNTTAKGGGTGDSLDLGVIDEAWSRPDSRTELGMRPAMLTRPWRQLWVCSMIPGLSRALPGSWPYLAHKRQVGRARVEAGMRSGTAFFDFAAADGLDPGDPATWWSCMPSLGHMISEKAVAEDFDAMELIDFCAEYLGWAPKENAPRWTLIRQQTWKDLHDPQSTVAGRPALSVEMAEDRSRGVVGVAGRREDRNWHVAVAEPGFRIAAGATGVEWMLPRVLELVREADACTVVIDPRRPAASLIVPLRNRGVDVLTPTVNDIAGACGRFYDATGEQAPEAAAPDAAPADPTRVFHLGQPVLARALGAARKLELGAGAFTLVAKGSDAEIIDLYAVVLAMHGAEVKGKAVPRSKVW